MTWIERNPLLTFVIIILLIFLFFRFKITKYDFASCLKKKGVILYGGPKCPKTQRQKEMFGSSAKNLPYVECEDANRNVKSECIKANIRFYPTWVFPNGQRTEGKILSFAEIKQYSGCDYRNQTEITSEFVLAKSTNEESLCEKPIEDIEVTQEEKVTIANLSGVWAVGNGIMDVNNPNSNGVLINMLKPNSETEKTIKEILGDRPYKIEYGEMAKAL